MSNNSDDPIGSINISADKEKPEPDQGPDIAIHSTPESDRSTAPPEPDDEFPPLDSPAGRRKLPSPAASRLKHLLGSAFLLLICYCLLGFLAVPYMLRTTLPDIFFKKTNRPMTVGSASFNPFTLKVNLHNSIVGPDLSNPEDQVDPLFSAGFIEADISWASFIQRRLTCSHFMVDGLFLHLVRDHEQNYNIFQILPEQSRQNFTFANLPFSFFFKNISLHQGRVYFDDLPAEKKHKLEEINLALPLLYHSSGKKITLRKSINSSSGYINPQFSAIINGSPVDLSGKTRVDGDNFEAQLQLHLKDIDLPSYLAYLPGQRRINVNNGTADTLLDLNLLFNPEQKISLEIETSSQFSDIRFRGKSNNINHIPAATLKGTLFPLESRYEIKEISLTGPELHLDRLKDGQWTFAGFDLTDTAHPEADKLRQLFFPDENTSLTFNKLTVGQGKVTFFDQQVEGGFTETISAINFNLTHPSQAEKPATSFSMSGKLAQNGTISLQGETTFSPFIANGHLTLDQYNMVHLSPYLPFADTVRIKQGKIDKCKSRFSLTFSGGKKFNPLLFQDTHSQLKNLILSHKEKEWLILPQASVGFDKYVPGAILDNVKIKVDRSQITLKWDEKNLFNWSSLWSKSKKRNQEQHITISSLELSDTFLHLENHTFTTPLKFSLDPVQISVEDFSTITGKKASFSLRTENLGGGSLSLSGPISYSPYTADLSCTLKNYSLAAYPTLVTDWLDVDGFSGSLDAKGKIELPHFSFQGSLQLHDFSATEKNGTDIIRCKKAGAKAAQLSYLPLSFSASKLSLEEPYLHWIFPAKGALNISTIFKKYPSGLKEPFHHTGQFHLDDIDFRKATLHFTDQRVTPHFSTTLQVEGKLGRLANKSGNRMTLDLKTMPDQREEISLKGEIGLFDDSLYADVVALFKNQPIDDFSPYLNSLFGYEMQKGLFTLTTDFHQESGTITADTTLHTSGLKLGRRTGAASQLPVTIALFSNSQGEMKLHLPVSGTTSDSSYTFANALGRVLRNLVLKTTVSPFSQLHSSFAEMEQVPGHFLFAPGSYLLTEKNQKDLTDLATIIAQRPLLTVTVKGFANTGSDKEALLDEKKEAMRQKELIKERTTSASLTKSYGNEEISAPPLPKISQHTPDTPPDLKVSKSELLKLARKREQAVRDYLVSTLKADGKRVLLDTTGSLISAHAPGRPGNRVDLKLGSIE